MTTSDSYDTTEAMLHHEGGHVIAHLAGVCLLSEEFGFWPEVRPASLFVNLDGSFGVEDELGVYHPYSQGLFDADVFLDENCMRRYMDGVATPDDDIMGRVDAVVIQAGYASEMQYWSNRSRTVHHAPIGAESAALRRAGHDLGMIDRMERGGVPVDAEGAMRAARSVVSTLWDPVQRVVARVSALGGKATYDELVLAAMGQAIDRLVVRREFAEALRAGLGADSVDTVSPGDSG